MVPPFGPINRRKLIATLKLLGFTGPYAGGRHQFMIRQNVRLVLPNPHEGDIGSHLLTRLLKQAGITREQWERTG